ncbi:MAG: alkaline phosphatase family protein, partial [Saprospiraceae bacterium]
AHYNYNGTLTGPGHASIYTGTTPSRHGIIGNDWYDREAGTKVNCVGDPGVKPLGGSGKGQGVSPHRMEVTTVTDELSIFTNHRAKVVGVSYKDRGATLPAGHNPTGAYWYDGATGEFVTSTYFRTALPDWLIAFNNLQLPKKYVQQHWEPLYPIETYTSSIDDDNPYEHARWRKETPTFPYDLSGDRNPYGSFYGSPFANTVLTELALAALEGEKMGTDAITDFLTISYSSTDSEGHAVGPRAVEIEDMYLRLDRDLAHLMQELDQKVGKDGYVLFISADHGVVDNSRYLVDHKYPAGRFGDSLIQVVREKVQRKYGEGEGFLDLNASEIFLNRPLIKYRGIDLAEIQTFTADCLMEFPFVSEVFTATALAQRNITDPFIQLVQNGYNTKRSGDVMMVMKSGFLYGKPHDKGTTHGTPYTYDTHIPILFYGAGIPAGFSVRKVAITDIAPTVSMLLEIPLPSGATGTPLLELFEQ